MINKEFRTVISVKTEKSKIDYNSRFFSIGSCFSIHMAAKFRYYGFQSVANPFGTLFHPLAIEDVFKQLFERSDFNVFKANNRWNCFQAHSDLSGSTEHEVRDNLQTAAASVCTEVPKSTHILITLGSAWAYRHNKTQKVVANCHKMPQQDFTKELLSVQTISDSISGMLSVISKVNPNAKVIFSVSPVRHLKDGFVENQRSKAHLLAAIHAVAEQSSRLCYFPAYEILMDDLRDYRFYDSDMLHPSAVAVDYVWQKFTAAYMDEQTQNIMNEVATYRKAKAHRPFDENGLAYRNFMRDAETKKIELEKRGVHLTD